jgi:thiamine-phosphate diphosphorylase
MTPDVTARYRLYLVLDPDHLANDIIETAHAALNNGVTCLQLRWKSAPDRQVISLARTLHEFTQPRGIPLILNDRLDIALAAGAEGVHLGVDDLSVEDARRLAGPRFLIGFSPECDADIVGAERAGASYLGIGPIFQTRTKADAGSALGATDFTRRRLLSNLPVVAIGGISEGNAREAFAAGADGIAVVSAILGSPDPGAATGRLRATVPRRA